MSGDFISGEVKEQDGPIKGDRFGPRGPDEYYRRQGPS